MSAYRFRPRWVPTLAAFALLPVLVQLGLWQWHKGQGKLALQQRMEALAKAAPEEIGSRLLSGDGWRYRPVTVRGRYEAEHQFLLDNQFQGEQVGFQVLTPLRIEGSEVRVLVNRGWVPLGRSRQDLPNIVPPSGLVEVEGTVWQPAPPKLGSPGDRWEPIWEEVDLARFGRLVPFPLQPFVVRLRAGAPGCYVCDWPRPDERAGVNLGYALQWFGMAGVLVGFYLFSSVERAAG